MFVTGLSAIYVLSVSGLSIFGLMALVTLYYYHRHRQDVLPQPVIPGTRLPKVTVQLPVYNERYVIERLIAAAANLNYPADLLQIQVIDDSTDDTTIKAQTTVDRFRNEGFDVCLIRRPHRRGYKAGALQAALEASTGEFIAVFDADFRPEPDFLLQTIPHFFDQPRLGLIQVRWGHLNPDASLLTKAQSMALDKHFALDQAVRYRAKLFPKFNGSAGVWRRACLEEAGGWETDTVCEDLCLSTRAILMGWDFRLLNDVVAPAELPLTMSAFKNQQSRWAKGATQCLLKFGRDILTAGEHSPIARGYALLSMAAYWAHLFLVTILLVQVPLIYLNRQPTLPLLWFVLASVGQPILLVVGQQTLNAEWRRQLRYLPAILVVAVGLAPANSRSIVEAIFGRRHLFIRTPKVHKDPMRGGQPPAPISEAYRLPFDWIILAELGLAAYAALGVLVSLSQGNFGPILFLGSCVLGFGYVGFSSIYDLFATGTRRFRE